MKPLAILATANSTAEEALIDSGWEVVGGASACPEALRQAGRADLVVWEIHAPDFARDLRSVVALRADAPDLPSWSSRPVWSDRGASA